MRARSTLCLPASLRPLPHQKTSHRPTSTAPRTFHLSWHIEHEAARPSQQAGFSAGRHRGQRQADFPSSEPFEGFWRSGRKTQTPQAQLQSLDAEGTARDRRICVLTSIPGESDAARGSPEERVWSPAPLGGAHHEDGNPGGTAAAASCHSQGWEAAPDRGWLTRPALRKERRAHSRISTP